MSAEKLTTSSSRASAATYCGVGSCDNPPGHDGIHRCRCGRPVNESANGCVWHRYPTVDDLEAENSVLKAALAVLEATIARVRATTILDGNPRYGTVPVSVLSAALEEQSAERTT